MASEVSESGTPKRKRRWLQYSLRTFLLLVAVLSVWLANEVNNAQKQRAAVAAIQENGGTVVFDWVRKNWLAPMPLDNTEYALVLERKGEFRETSWFESILGSEYFDRVEAVYFSDETLEERVSPESLDALDDLPNLVELQFYGGIIDDDGIRRIAKHQDLEVLHLMSFRVTDSGFRHLSALKKLRKLFLYAPKATDEVVVETVKELPRLEELHIAGKLAKESIAEIQQALPNCQVIIVNAQGTHRD